MKILRELSPEAIKKYEHIRPAPAFGGGLRCWAQCPGETRTCTLAKGHDGPHVAHGFRKKVMAVWWEEGFSSETPSGQVSGAGMREALLEATCARLFDQCYHLSGESFRVTVDRSAKDNIPTVVIGGVLPDKADAVEVIVGEILEGAPIFLRHRIESNE